MTTPKVNHRFLLPLLIFSVAGAWNSLSASEFLCRNGDLSRRVEVGPGQNAACEVRYWRNAASASDPQVLWRAARDADFCDTQARELLDTLEAGGWTCAALDQPPRPEAEAIAPAPAPSQRDAPAPEPPVREARLPAEPAPAAGAQAEPPVQAPQTERPAPTQPEPPAAAPQTEQPAAAPQPEPAAGASRDVALLDRVVDQTLRSVQQLYGGDFRAEDTAFGDLDGDGQEDAAILVTYEADGDDYVQYLVAYLFDGQTYRSSATKNVSGRFLDARRAEVQGIVDRSIVVELEAQNGEAPCCETRQTAFALEDGQLVEVDRLP